MMSRMNDLTMQQLSQGLAQWKWNGSEDTAYL